MIVDVVVRIDNVVVVDGYCCYCLGLLVTCMDFLVNDLLIYGLSCKIEVTIEFVHLLKFVDRIELL